MSSLTGKVALVTGASSGIGFAVAEALAAKGAQVFGLCRRIGQIPESCQAISCDLRNPERIAHAFEILGDSAPQLDILVNNAGRAYLSRLTDGDPSDWEEMWEVNVRALAVCSQQALKHFPATGGRIINVSSLSGHRVPPTGGFYAPTKFAVRAITEALRNEIRLDGSPHQISSVSPGFVETPLVKDYFKDCPEQLEQVKASMKMLTPADIAREVVHIAESPASVEIGDIILRSPIPSECCSAYNTCPGAIGSCRPRTSDRAGRGGAHGLSRGRRS
mgnify:CR=1 FL=1